MRVFVQVLHTNTSNLNISRIFLVKNINCDVYVYRYWIRQQSTYFKEENNKTYDYKYLLFILIKTFTKHFKQVENVFKDNLVCTTAFISFNVFIKRLYFFFAESNKTL